MAYGDRFYRKAREKLEAHVGEPVEVIGWAARTGAMNAVIANQLGLGGMAPRGRMVAAGGEQGAKLPLNFLVALTPTALRVFRFRRGWTGIRIKKELGALPREGLELSIEDAKATKRFHLRATDGS